MPRHFEYVLTAYGLWVGVFALYFAYLVHKAHRTRRALERLAGRADTSEGSQAAER